MSRFGARGSKPSAGEERSGKRGFGSDSPRLPNRAAEVSEVHKIDTPRNAFEDLRTCICIQRSAYTARSATQRAVLHSAQRCTVRSAAQRAAHQSAQRHTARSGTQRAALHNAQRYTVPGASLRPALHCAQRYTVRSATQRAALHSAQRFTAPSVAQCAALYSPPPPSSAAQRAALHSAQHYTAPSIASQDKADRSKRTKPVAQRGFVAFSLFD